MKKILFLGTLMVLMLALLAGCAAPAPAPTATATPTPTPEPEATATTAPDSGQAAGEEKTFTLAELAAFNGKDGQPAYIAVDGIVYDVTDNTAWNEGMHEGYGAGADLTAETKASPHGTAVLEGVPVVGKLVADTVAEAPVVLTLEELAAYDGSDGKPAYIAVDGLIYDVTDSAFWKGGAHNGFTAGKDLTEEIKGVSPHGVSVLERIPVVGELAAPQESGELLLTLEELAAYNGKDGKPAYVAVNGIIYDMTNSAMWRNGSHNGYEAGKDLTDAIINKSPHGLSTLDRVPVVGKIKE